jgi:hypothetical protein
MFANVDAARRFDDNDPEGVAFDLWGSGMIRTGHRSAS